MINLGGKPRSLDLRDIKLGAVQAPVEIPKEYKTDISWLTPIWQDGVPACGAHAGVHLKQILDYFDLSADKVNYSPRYLWLKIKSIDGYPPEVGTDMRSIFKSLLGWGVCDYGLLPNKFPTTTEAYSTNVTTPEMDGNANPRVIKAYAFDTPANLKQAIYQNKAVLVLLDVGETWWGKGIAVPFKNYYSGHFIVAYGYDEDYIYIIDSADRQVPFKRLLGYPIREVGTAIDLPNEQIRSLIRQKEQLQTIIALMQKILSIRALLIKRS